MDFRDSPEMAAFRQEVRQWIRDEVPPAQRIGRGLPGTGEKEAWERTLTIRKKLATRGWIAPAWPKES